MIILKTDTDIQGHLDRLSHEFITDQIKKDCLKFSEQINSKINEWIGRTILFKGSDHKDSKIKFGFLLRYQFQKLDNRFETGIREIRLAESMDEFLDMYNIYQKDENIFNIEKRK